MKLISEKTLPVFKFLKAHQGEDLTAQDIAEAMDLPVRSVNGIITAGLQRKGIAERETAEVEVVEMNEEGEEVKHQKKVKFIRLTAYGAGLTGDEEKPEKAE